MVFPSRRVERTTSFRRGKIRIFFEKKVLLILLYSTSDTAEIDVLEFNSTGNYWSLSVNVISGWNLIG